MIYLLLDATDKKTIKSVSSGEFQGFPEEYISVSFEGEVPEQFKEDYSLFEYVRKKIILKK